MGTLVLLPGLDGTGLLFADFIAALGPGIETNVVAYPCQEFRSYAELEDVARALLPAKRPFVLLGESFGGPVAISIAASRPPGLVGLILCCTFAKYPRPILRKLHRVAPYVPVSGPIVSLVRDIFAPAKVSDAVRAKLTDARDRVAKSVLRARIGELLRVDLTNELAQIDVPILDLRARRDGVVPNRAGDDVRTRGRKVRAVDVDGPHFILLAKPVETAAIVKDFLRSLPGT